MGSISRINTNINIQAQSMPKRNTALSQSLSQLSGSASNIPSRGEGLARPDISTASRGATNAAPSPAFASEPQGMSKGKFMAIAAQVGGADGASRIFGSSARGPSTSISAAMMGIGGKVDQSA
jgi:hypothetical protein